MSSEEYQGTLAARVARETRAVPLALRGRASPDRVGSAPTVPQPVLGEAPFQVPMRLAGKSSSRYSPPQSHGSLTSFRSLSIGSASIASNSGG